MPFGHHHHHHQGILSRIEDELEQLSVSADATGARQQGAMPGNAAQQSYPYGQGYGTYPPSTQPPSYGQPYGSYGNNSQFGPYPNQPRPGAYELPAQTQYGMSASTQSYGPNNATPSYGQPPMPPQGINQNYQPPRYPGPPQYNVPPPGQYTGPQTAPPFAQSSSPYPPPGPPSSLQSPPLNGMAQSVNYPPQQQGTYPGQPSSYPSPLRPDQYPGPSHPNLSQPYNATPNRSGYGGLATGAAIAGTAALAYGAYEHHQNGQGTLNSNVANVQMPAQLDPQQFVVQFVPLYSELRHCTHHHTMKLLSEAHHSVSKMSQIIGTYLMAKEANGHATYGTAGSRPEVREYYYEMDLIEKLSADFISKHSSKQNEWKEALAPHRRQIFCQLYNRNELVRAFCTELPGGPLHLPQLDRYSLGEKVSLLHFPKSAVRQANKSAPLDVLAQVRTVMLIDDSYSMTEPGHHTWGSRSDSRWDQARGVMRELAPLVAQHNAHGVDLHLLNRVPFYVGLRTAMATEQAMDADRPNNGTPTGRIVNNILDAYVSVLRYYRHLLPLNLIVVTDGEANDEELLHQAIEHHVTELVHRGFPAHQFGAEFVQVGDCEHATRHLEKLEKEVSRHHHRFQRDVIGVTPTNRIARMHAQELLAIAVSGIDARMNSYMRHRGVNV